MDNETKAIVIFVIGSFGMLWYFYCLIDIGARPQPNQTNPGGFRAFQILSITTIGTSLATVVGLLLGLRDVSENINKNGHAVGEIRTQVTEIKPEVAKIKSEVTKIKDAINSNTMTPDMTKSMTDAAAQAESHTETQSQVVNQKVEEATKQVDQAKGGLDVLFIQTKPSQFLWMIVGLYVLSLCLALVFWRLHGDQTDPAITHLGRSFLGLAMGAISAVLILQ